MAVRRILKCGEKMLKVKTKKVDFQAMKDKIPEILKDMYDTLSVVNGIGLSANQIGIDMQIAIINYYDKEKNKTYNFVMINPQIVKAEGEVIDDEGCLSFPGLFLKIKRSEKVQVQALNEKGIPIVIKGEGLLARALQHEIDHLNGITIYDHLSLAAKLKLKPTLIKLKRQWKKMDESKNSIM